MVLLKYSSLAAMLLVCLQATDIIVRVNSFIGESNGSTAVVLAIYIFVAGVLLLLAKKTNWKNQLPRSARICLALVLFWNVVTFFRGAATAQEYWAWKALLTSHLFMLMMPLSIAVGLNAKYVASSLSAILFFIFPIALLLIPAALSFDTELFQRASLPVYFLVLLLPFQRRRWQLLVIVIATISVCMDFSYRTNVLRILVAVFIAGSYPFQARLRPAALNAFWLSCFAIPIVLLALGASGRYDVFRDGVELRQSVQVVEGGVLRESPLDADTRSFLYDEVFSSMQKRGSSWIVGQGAGTGYDSFYFTQSTVGSGGRGGSEVGFLNTLLYSGAVGVLLYAAILCLAVFYAFNRSNNGLCKLLGLFLLFKWLLFFIEDIPQMDLNNFCTWTIIGLCLSNSFRSLRNSDVNDFLQGTAPRFLRSRPAMQSKRAFIAGVPKNQSDDERQLFAFLNRGEVCDEGTRDD